MVKLLLAFALVGLSLLCAAYFILAYYWLVSLAKGIEAVDIVTRRALHRGATVSAAWIAKTGGEH